MFLPMCSGCGYNKEHKRLCGQLHYWRLVWTYCTYVFYTLQDLKMKGKNRKKLTWTVNIEQKVFYHLYKLYKLLNILYKLYIVQILTQNIQMSRRHNGIVVIRSLHLETKFTGSNPHMCTSITYCTNCTFCCER